MLPWQRFFGWDRHYLAQQAMSQMPGEQDFLADTPKPDWLQAVQ